MNDIHRGLLPLEYHLHLCGEWVADGLVPDLAMITAKQERGHTKGQISIFCPPLPSKVQCVAVAACIVHQAYTEGSVYHAT